MKYPFFRGAYNYDLAAASAESAIESGGASLTVQSMAEDADINVIVKRFGLTGRLPEDPRVPTYGDFTGISSYRDALEVVMAADSAFMEFPADVRARFGNDPQLLMDFVGDDTNVDEARKLGLLKPTAEVPAPLLVKVVPDPASAA